MTYVILYFTCHSARHGTYMACRADACRAVPMRNPARENPTGVGIDIEGNMISHIRFPGFATYEPPTIDEEHIDDLLTEDEIKELEKAEIEYEKQERKRKESERIENMKKRAQKRARIL